MDVLSLAQQILKFDTSGPPTKEGPLAQWLKQWLDDSGIPARLQWTAPDRANVIAKMGEGTEPGLLLSGHIDVVPAGDPKLWTVTQPFIPLVTNGKLYARGACDMKGPCACILQAAYELRKQPWKRQLSLAFTAGEDTDGWFVANVLADRLLTKRDSRYGIVAEPSMLAIIPAHKGIGRVSLAIHGKAAHSSRPEIAVNAILQSILAIEEAQKLQTRLAVDRHPLMGTTTIKPTLISSGYKWNIIPDRCELFLNFRVIPPHQGEKSIRSLVEQILTACQDRDPRFRAEILAIKASPALDVPVESEIVTILEQILGTKAEGVPYATEAVDYTEAGIPTVVCGPGSIDQAHAPNEFITIDQLERGVQVFKEVISATCL